MKDDYFISGDFKTATYYRVDHQSLPNTLGIRKKLAKIFKPAFMNKKESINFTTWLALQKNGYCFSGTPGQAEDQSMAMDVITKDGFIKGIIVGALSTCDAAKIDLHFTEQFPPIKEKHKMGGGC